MAYTFLFMDYETFSLLDLKEVGIDNYSKHPSTGMSMLAWALDEEEVELWLPHTGPPPQKLLDALRDPRILKVAWNASFEYSITNRIFAPAWAPDLSVPLEQWRDPIVLARNISMPGKLESVGAILNLRHQKDPRGDELKDMFCKPVSKGGEMTLFGIAPPLFRDHTTHPEEFKAYGEYCKQDVRSEREAWFKMLKIPFPEEQWVGWILDQRINWRGMPGRRDIAEKGLRLAQRFIKEQKEKLKAITGLENPNSDPQMKAWLKPRGYPWESMRAPTVAAELKNKDTKLTEEAKAALKLRSSARKSSYTKLERFLALLSDDDMLRMQLSYMGASRTGRWKSGGKEEESASFQVQNMSRGEKAVKKKLDLALKLIAAEDYDGIVNAFTKTENPKDSVTVVEVVISCLRSLFQARPGYRIVVADKNAIENRMLGWAAGCKAILDVFRTCDKCGHLTENAPSPFKCEACGGKKPRDPYLAFAVFMYKMTYEQLRDEYKAGVEDKRQNSKPPVLGAGYALGGGEMFYNEYGDEVRGGLWGYALTVCGVDMKKEDAHAAVKYFREAYPEVVQLWLDLEEAFKQVLLKGGVIKVGEVTWVRDHDENCDMDPEVDPVNRKCHCHFKWMPHPTQGKQCVLTFRRIDMGGGKYSIRLELPSGRALHYLNATLDAEDKVSKKTGRPYTMHVLHYDGIEHSATQGEDGKNKKKHHKWGRVKTYGGKLTENVVQAMSRDDLLNSMFLADEMGFEIWGMFHDELACEVPDDGILRLEDLNWCMCQVPSWAPGFILGAEGYEAPYYKKG